MFLPRPNFSVIQRSALQRVCGLAVLFFLAAETRVDAGCGDYLWVRGPDGQLVRAVGLTHHDPLTHFDPMHRHEMTDPLGETSRSRLPCNGPECHGLPSTPVPPLPAPFGLSFSSSREMFAPRTMAEETTPVRGWLFIAVDSLAEIFRPQDIFEPPR